MIETAAVIGAGTMGKNIALVFAAGGLPVRLYDACPEVLQTAKEHIKKELFLLSDYELLSAKTIPEILDRIILCGDLKPAVWDIDYILEAVPENLKLKQELFKSLDKYCRGDSILSSNTSSLDFYEIIKFVSDERKKYCMLCHWYHPAHIIPLAELSFFGNMPETIYLSVETLYSRLGKQTVKVLKDIPGLIANRIQQSIAREVFSLIEQGAASPKDIDKALKFGPAFRYAASGQLETADMGGLDIWCTVADNLLPAMDSKAEANPVLRQKVISGQLGFKTGGGFFKYPPETAAKQKDAFNRRLITQLKASKHYI